MGVIFSIWDRFEIERMISFEPSVTVGIVSNENINNELDCQGIRILDDSTIYKLKSMKKNENLLEYHFENNIIFRLMREGRIKYEVCRGDEMLVEGHMNSIVMDSYQIIGMNSRELDEIYYFIKGDKL